MTIKYEMGEGLMKLSVGIITFNEENRIGKTLDSVREIADEIIIVDSESTDRTVEIALSKGAKVFVEKWKGYGPQKNSVLEKCKGKWILLIDADEVISTQLKEKIKTIINSENPSSDVYKIKLRNIAFKREIKFGGWDDYVIRLWKNGKVKISSREVHEQYQTDSKIKKIKEMREKYSDLSVVCYINSTAEIKAHCDVCITSSNALKIVSKLKEKNIFIVPDGNLASYIAKQVKNKNIILNEGYCCVHNLVHLENVKKLKEEYPNAKVLAHPECKEEILKLADYIGSTSGIIAEALKEGDEFIIVTERGIRFEIYKKAPNKKLHFADTLICRSMKKNTLEKIEKILTEGGDELKVDDEIAKKALIPLERMLELAGD